MIKAVLVYIFITCPSCGLTLEKRIQRDLEFEALQGGPAIVRVKR